MHSVMRNKNRQGAATVEFAIAISVLLMVIFASIEFVRLSIVKHSIEDASYVGAREAIVMGATVTDVQNAIDDHLAVFDIQGAVVTVNPNPLDDDTDFVRVDVDAPISANAWIVPSFFTGTLNGQTRMIAERDSAKMKAASANATQGRSRGQSNGGTPSATP